MTFQTIMKEKRKELGYTLKDIANKMNVTEATVQRWESGNIKSLRQGRIAQLAEILETTPSVLMGWETENDKKSDYKTIPFKNYDLSQYENISPVKLKRFPMLGEIACGQPIWAEEDRDSYIMADMDIRADFCLTAKGDSMINARIYDGDIVFIREMPIVENGEIAAVIIGDEATLKRWYYYREDNKLMLIAENPKYEPLVYMNEELDTIKCLGKAVYFMSAL